MSAEKSIHPLCELRLFLENSIVGIDCSYNDQDLIIQGTPPVFQDVRHTLSMKKITFEIIRNPQYHTISEIRVSAVDVKNRDFPIIEKKPQKVEVKKVQVLKPVSILPKPEVKKEIKTEKIAVQKQSKPAKKAKVKVSKVEKKVKVKVKKPSLRPSDKRRYKDPKNEEYRILYSAPTDALIDALLAKPKSAHDRFLQKLRRIRKNNGASP